MPGNGKQCHLYVYQPVYNRLLDLQRRMTDAKGGRKISLDAVIEALLDQAREREDQGA